MSSTAIVLQSLNERGLLKTLGRALELCGVVVPGYLDHPDAGAAAARGGAAAADGGKRGFRRAAGVGGARWSCSPSSPRSCLPAAI